MLTCLATSTLRALIVRVCQPRPDTTHVGTGGVGWCWCQRTGCKSDSLFITLPTYMRQHGFVTAGNGKLFHPVSASAPPYGGRLRSPTLSIRTCNVCLFPFPRISCNRMHAVQMGLRTRKATTLERGRTERTMWKPTSLKNNGVRACAALLIPKKKNQVHRITTPEYVFIFKLPPPLLPPPLHHHRHRHLKHTHTRARATTTRRDNPWAARSCFQPHHGTVFHGIVAHRRRADRWYPCCRYSAKVSKLFA